MRCERCAGVVVAEHFTLLEVRPLSEAGPMVDGGVSIAVRSVYPGKQARILCYEVLREAKKLPAKSCAEHKVSSAMT